MVNMAKTADDTHNTGKTKFFTWFIRAIFTVAVIIIHLLKWDDF